MKKNHRQTLLTVAVAALAALLFADAVLFPTQRVTGFVVAALARRAR